MTREWLSKPVYNYDSKHDLLSIFYSDRYNYYGDDEFYKEFPDLYVLRDDDTEEIIGFTIFFYSKYKPYLPKLYPQCFKNLNELPKSNAEMGEAQ